MHIFFCEQPASDEFILDQVESNHLSRVLRLKSGDIVSVINGDGSLYECIITEPDSRKARVRVTGIRKNFDRRTHWLHIAIAPTKSMERFEMFLEKAVELGIDEITPLVTARSERHTIRIDRIKKIIVSAMKQSLKSKGTVINNLTGIESFIGKPGDGQLFIAHCIESVDSEYLGKICVPGGKVTVMIGPEGDFTLQEVEDAQAGGYESITLGPGRLRTETAGIAACSLVSFINQLAIS